MPTCPNCNTDIRSDAEFCPGCGESLTRNCPSCNEPLPAEAQFCSNCGRDLSAEGGHESSGQAADGSAWRLAGDEFAKRLDGDALGPDGWKEKLQGKQTVKIESGNRALLLKNGELVDGLGPGKHTLDSFLNKLKNFGSSAESTVVILENSGCTVTRTFDDVRTREDYLVTVTLELVVSVSDPGRFFTSMLSDRDTLTTGTFSELLGRALENVLADTLSNFDHDELYGNREVRSRLEDQIKHEAADVLSRNGLELVELLSFDYADDREELRQRNKDLDIRAEREDQKDTKAELDRREREREADDTVHQQNQRVRKEASKQAADHTIEKQSVEQDHELDDKERRHEHKAEKESVEHEEDVKTHRTESEVDRRDIKHEQSMKERSDEHEQDVDEIEDLLDIKQKKDEQKLNKEERKQEMEMEKEEHEVEVEQKRLDARDDVDAQTLASLDDTETEEMADLAKMDKAENLNADHLDSLGAQDSDELAKARQEANKAEKERERVEDQKEFREEMKDVMEGSMDRIQETTESAMDNMGEAASTAAEDSSDNVIVSGDSGDSASGDTTIVQGGSGGRQDPQSGQPSQGGDQGQRGHSETGSQGKVICPNCGAEEPADNDFCMGCGEDLSS